MAGSLSGSEALKVTKELTGRKWLDTDTFSYTLTAADEATVEAIENGFITLPENAGGLEITKASAGHQAAFGDIQLRSPERSSSMLRSSQAVSPVLRTIRKRKELWL